MKRSIRKLTIPAVALAVGAGASSGNAVGHPAALPATSSATAKVEAIHTKLGTVLADGRGHTLYLFEKDKGSRSACFGTCAKAWPPLTTTGKPKASSGISASKLGTISRGNGVKQVTYNGHPLYGFVKDTSPRQTHGEGVRAFGAEWYALSPAGKKVEKAGS
jgi:predicted lipoprotein with Yx(FWY)xxD motif